MCENDVAKQEFLLETNPDADMLIDNSKELDKTFTRNKRDNMRVVSIPAVFMFIAGSMRSDKCPNSTNRVTLKGSMQRGDGKTSDTFQDAMAYIRRMLPTIVILGNPKELLTPVIGGLHLSDDIYIIKCLTLAGYQIVTTIISKAEQHG